MGVLEASRLRRDRRQALSCHDSYYAVLNCASHQASEVVRESGRLNWRIVVCRVCFILERRILLRHTYSLSKEVLYYVEDTSQEGQIA